MSERVLISMWMNVWDLESPLSHGSIFVFFSLQICFDIQQPSQRLDFDNSRFALLFYTSFWTAAFGFACFSLDRCLGNQKKGEQHKSTKAF